MRRSGDVTVTVTLAKEERHDLVRLAMRHRVSLASLWRKAMNHYLMATGVDVSLVEVRQNGRPSR
jgi:hypothetical protein